MFEIEGEHGKTAFRTVQNYIDVEEMVLRKGAHKPIDDIIGPIYESVDIIDVMRPAYNFKAM